MDGAALEPQLSLWQRFMEWWRTPREAAARERERYIAHLERENEELKQWLKSLNGSLVAGLGMPIVPTGKPEERRPVTPIVRAGIPSLRRSAFEARTERKAAHAREPEVS